MISMLHNEARNLLVAAYQKTHDAKGIAQAYGVSVPTVYRLVEQKEKNRKRRLAGERMWPEASSERGKSGTDCKNN